MRPGVGSAVFLGVMIVASVLSFLRVVAVAGQLQTQGFAIYATITATGAFLSSLISFGSVEATIKRFPRLVADGHRGRMVGDARAIVRQLLVRAAVLGAATWLAGRLVGVGWIEQAGIAFIFAATTAHSGVIASMQRAAGNPRSLALGTLMRAGVVFLAVAAAARSGSLTGTLAAEGISTLLVCLLSERLFFGPAERGERIRAARLEGDGLKLFAAYTLIAMPAYLDRLFVLAVFGATIAGQYAVLGVLLTGATLLVNTIAQRVGPDAIRLVHAGRQRDAVRQIATWSVLTGALWLCAIGGFAGIVALGLLPPAYARYELAPALLAPIALSGVLLTAGFAEFLAIALDREALFLRCAALFALCVLAAAGVAAATHPALADLLWLLAAARAIYAAALIGGLARGTQVPR